MNFIESIKDRAKQQIKTIVLPEAEDIRTLKATETVLNEKYAKIILIGDEEKIFAKAKENKYVWAETEDYIDFVLRDSEAYPDLYKFLYDMGIVQRLEEERMAA